MIKHGSKFIRLSAVFYAALDIFGHPTLHIDITIKNIRHVVIYEIGHTPVCTTEIMTFASMKDLFAANNTSLLGLSVDSNTSHIAWTRDMAKYSWKNINNPMITFPIIADDFGNVARMYGMLMPSVSSTKTVRTVFIVDGEGMIRAILVYPLTTGRNMQVVTRA
jgi:peroxiredoxin (alkyl hydroperoxide reductase subunit C)